MHFSILTTYILKIEDFMGMHLSKLKTQITWECQFKFNIAASCCVIGFKHNITDKSSNYLIIILIIQKITDDRSCLSFIK